MRPDAIARDPNLAGRRVLIVEDEMLVAMDLESILVGQHCEIVDIVSTVATALEAIEKQRPDAVMLDLNLDGERTTAVAECLGSREIPFVVTTGFVGGKALDQVLRNAPRVEKPWNPAEVVRKLSLVLPRD